MGCWVQVEDATCVSHKEVCVEVVGGWSGEMYEDMCKGVRIYVYNKHKDTHTHKQTNKDTCLCAWL